MQADRDTFGPRLKQERERRGIALKHIADATKIKESLFAELERNDFSNWPDGIFRRAHLCAYASAIGLPPQPILAEYVRLFPEAQPSDLSGRAPVFQPAGQTAAPARVAPSWVDRVWVMSFDAAAVFLLASAVAGSTRMNLWQAIALAGLTYSAVGSAWFAQTIGRRLQQRLHTVLEAPRPTQGSAMPPRLDVQPIAFKQPRLNVSTQATNREREIGDRRASA